MLHPSATQREHLQPSGNTDFFGNRCFACAEFRERCACFGIVPRFEFHDSGLPPLFLVRILPGVGSIVLIKLGSRFRVPGSGFRIAGSGFGVQDSGFKFHDYGVRVRHRVQGSGFEVPRRPPMPLPPSSRAEPSLQPSVPSRGKGSEGRETPQRDSDSMVNLRTHCFSPISNFMCIHSSDILRLSATQREELQPAGDPLNFSKQGLHPRSDEEQSQKSIPRISRGIDTNSGSRLPER